MNNLHSKANYKLEKFYKDLLLNNPEFFEGILKRKPRSHSPQNKLLDNSDKFNKRSIISNQGSTLNKQSSKSSINCNYNTNSKNKMCSIPPSNTIRMKKKIKSSSTEKDFRKKFQLMLNSPIDNCYLNKRDRSVSNDKKKRVYKGNNNNDDNLSTPIRGNIKKRDIVNKSKSNNFSLDCNITNNSNSNTNTIISPKYKKKKNNSMYSIDKKKISIKTTSNIVIKKNKINNTNTNVNNNKKRENIKIVTNSPSIWNSILQINNQKQAKRKSNSSNKENVKKKEIIKENTNEGIRLKNHNTNCDNQLLTGILSSIIPENLSDKPNTNHNPKPTINKKISKIEILSRAGYGGPGDIKINQDNYFIFKHLNDEPNTFFIGVCDGHGLTGQDISKFLITHLPKRVHSELKATNKYISNKETRNKAIIEAFVTTNQKLCQMKLIDTQYSGSTCSTIILKKNKIISANTGDSRSVLGRFNSETNTWNAIDLTRDHKPSDIEESERIIAHGGRIESYRDEYGKPFGPPRIWLQNEDLPGLAMTRSFGDEVAANVGTISIPEIKEFKLTNEDKFVIVASDGIWEYINSTECVDFVKDYYFKNDPSGCLTFLWNESSRRWINEEERIDDITCILIFFENND